MALKRAEKKMLRRLIRKAVADRIQDMANDVSAFLPDVTGEGAVYVAEFLQTWATSMAAEQETL